MCLTCINATDNNTLTQDSQLSSNDNSIITKDNINSIENNNDIYINENNFNKKENIAQEVTNNITDSKQNNTQNITDKTNKKSDKNTQSTDNLLIKENKNIKTSNEKIIYVSPKGNDKNSGTKNNPVKTIQYALSIANNYDIIYLSSGTYLEHKILIDKDINIVGENPKTTIINAQNNHLFTIASNKKVSIKTLAIKNTFDSNGGAIYNKGNLSMKHVRLYCNQARNGGAIYNKGSLYMFKSLFMANNAKYGSCIYNTNTFEANKCVFAQNKAVQFGSIYSTGYINLLSCNFTDNTNSSIFIEKSAKESTINSCVFTNNKAVHAAAIYNKDSSLDVKYSYFENNTATNYGAAIYTSGKSTITDSKFNKNNAYNGVVANKKTLTITDSTFESNNAVNEGGAVYNTYELKIINSTFESNTAKNGAAISSTSNTKKDLNIDSSTFLSNTAKIHGSAVYITNKNRLILKNSLITYNTNRSVYLRCDGEISNIITNSTLTKNNGDTGSAIFNHKSTLSVTKSTITKNTDTIKGAIYNNMGKTTVNYCIVGENNKIDIANFKGSVNADYNWWLKNSVNSNNINGLNVNNWVYLKLDVDSYELNKKSTTTASVNQVYNGKSFTTIDASKLPSFTINITVNGGGVSKSVEKSVTNGVLSVTDIYTKEGSVSASAYTYNYKTTCDFAVKSNLIKSKITSYFVQIGYTITKSIVNTWINLGVTDVYVQTVASTSNTANLRNVAKLCKNTPIRVHAWVICFSNDDISTARQNVVKSFVKNVIKIDGVNGVCLDYVRYSGLHPEIVNPSKITEFVKSVNSIIKGYNKNLQLSACVFAEKAGTKTYYGQDYYELSKYVDVMLPMTYKYEYNSGRDWLKSSTSYVVDRAKYCKVVSVLQSYDNSLNRLSKSELEADAKAVMSAGSYGYSIFRYGLISSYPKNALSL